MFERATTRALKSSPNDFGVYSDPTQFTVDPESFKANPPPVSQDTVRQSSSSETAENTSNTNGSIEIPATTPSSSITPSQLNDTTYGDKNVKPVAYSYPGCYGSYGAYYPAPTNNYPYTTGEYPAGVPYNYNCRQNYYRQFFMGSLLYAVSYFINNLMYRHRYRNY